MINEKIYNISAGVETEQMSAKQGAPLAENVDVHPYTATPEAKVLP